MLRSRLIERLNDGLRGVPGVTLISAPAGFGKTTLVSEWVAGCTQPVAWLSLDEGDGDATRFMDYLVAALQTVVPTLGEGALAVLHTSKPQDPPTESILTSLLNDITALPQNISLVLDDYHVVESKAVDQALNFLIDHLPPQLHVIIVTREDPDLPLARLRVRGQLTELRAADLRFTGLADVLDDLAPADCTKTISDRKENMRRATKSVPPRMGPAIRPRWRRG